ncbi:cold-shock protein [Bradyrhizobium cenepequi]|uniref:cold-shock protein n=1 Tax=Bradyrhizobium cenepequi TaxID=2821403 RepID=UPI001CE26C55|nr:cold shock domain-containing protein [Bradyrhizobium cenepequi]MCA6109607.1 cold shock domain-containing protein [Bradyrhizobium cenepequi]
MNTGTLRSWSHLTGYGFLTVDGDEDASIFVHASKLRLAGVEFPSVGMRFTFDVAENPGRKPFATRLRAIDDSY